MLCSFLQVAHSQQTAGKDLEVVRIRPNFYVIFGAGGNIAVQLGPTGVLLVNTRGELKRGSSSGNHQEDYG
jgi:hypothetical protein